MGLSDLRCDQCGKQPAAVRYTQVEGGHIRKGHLCAACARARGLLEIAPVHADKSLVCAQCGLAFADFQQQGRLGCPACYVAFAAEMLPLLRQIHGHVEHTGKSPGGNLPGAGQRRQIDDLRLALDEAVRGEDYERAATLRDEIRALDEAPPGAQSEGDGPAGKTPPQEAR